MSKVKQKCLFLIFVVIYLNTSVAQVLQFGSCVEVETMKYFDVERFLGQWYVIERFPIWFEEYGQCAYKRIQSCGRRIEIEHTFVRDEILYVLHLNSTYTPGDEAVFEINETNIDPIGIPFSVITTDYSNYAVVYGCKTNEVLKIKYIAAWILSRETTLSEDILQQARQELNSIPYASTVYLQKVYHSEEKCRHHWTAHVQAINTKEDDVN